MKYDVKGSSGEIKLNYMECHLELWNQISSTADKDINLKSVAYYYDEGISKTELHKLISE